MPHLPGSAKCFALLRKVSAAAVAPLGAHPEPSHPGCWNSSCVCVRPFERQKGRAGSELAQTINWKLPLRYGGSRPLTVYRPASVTRLRRCRRGWGCALPREREASGPPQTARGSTATPDPHRLSGERGAFPRETRVRVAGKW